jgi:hypothetical protein
MLKKLQEGVRTPKFKSSCAARLTFDMGEPVLPWALLGCWTGKWSDVFPSSARSSPWIWSLCEAEATQWCYEGLPPH